jgi:hypothetical protein
LPAVVKAEWAKADYNAAAIFSHPPASALDDPSAELCRRRRLNRLDD